MSNFHSSYLNFCCYISVNFQHFLQVTFCLSDSQNASDKRYCSIGTDARDFEGERFFSKAVQFVSYPNVNNLCSYYWISFDLLNQIFISKFNKSSSETKSKIFRQDFLKETNIYFKSFTCIKNKIDASISL